MLVKLFLHDGTTYEEHLEDFSLPEFIMEINTAPHKMVQFGKIGVIGHNIKVVDTSQGGYTFNGPQG